MTHRFFGVVLAMFIREKKNKSGSVSIQIIQKINGKSSLVKTIGSALDPQSIANLLELGKQEVYRLQGQNSLFVFEKDALIESFLSELNNAQIRTVGPELVFGKIYDAIGFNAIQAELFRHLVIARLAFPLSKLKTIEYLNRYQGLSIEVDTIYRFLDKLNKDLKEQVEQINFKHTQKILNNNIGIVFYDMTTLYFEASDEDDLRKTGFSKDGKHSNPQIFLGLLVALGGYAIGYDIFEGNIFEGHTLIPVIEKLSKKFSLLKPIVVADAGLLSNDNIIELEAQGYQYILGARIKNESKAVQVKILDTTFHDESYVVIDKEKSKLIVQYSTKRANKDEHNRAKGLQRLEKQIKSGKLSKKNINNRGYNKFLKMEGEVNITIDKEKFEQDKKWNGLKGYITNCTITPQEVMDNYRNCKFRPC